VLEVAVEFHQESLLNDLRWNIGDNLDNLIDIGELLLLLVVGLVLVDDLLADLILEVLMVYIDSYVVLVVVGVVGPQGEK
jgi:hypothetical protein